MNITNITVKKIEGQKVLRGVASVVFDDQLKVREIKILEKEDKGLYIMMPNKKIGEDKYVGMPIRLPRNAVCSFRKQPWEILRDSLTGNRGHAARPNC